MKTRVLTTAGIVGSVAAALFISHCGATSAVEYSLSNPPAGFVFTNTAGNQVDKMGSGSTAQLRDTSGKILLQFFVNGLINFQNVVAGRDSTRTLIHFPAASDKYGLSGYLLLFLPCTATTDEVHVCPSAATLSEVTSGCTGELTLTAANPASGAYTWSNASTKTDIDDCQIKANVSDFGTGAFGISTSASMVIEEDLSYSDDESADESADAGTE
jgi:hypothetical protein